MINLLKEIVFLEREVESAKIDLALKSDFNLKDAFHMFDSKQYSQITPPDLMEGLHMNLGMADFCEEDVMLFFARHDPSCRGRINFIEFSQALLPFSSEYSGLITDRPEFFLRRGVCPS